jgi:hypothetical protein
MPFAYVLGALIGGWVGRAILWVFANKIGTILVGLGLGITAFAGTSYIVGQIESVIASAYSGSASMTVQGVNIGALAWNMFKLAGGGDAVLMIAAAYTSSAAIVASRAFISRLVP